MLAAYTAFVSVKLSKKGLYGRTILNNAADYDGAIDAATWILIADNKEFLTMPKLRERLAKMDTNIPLWTDDYSNIFRILK